MQYSCILFSFCEKTIGTGNLRLSEAVLANEYPDALTSMNNLAKVLSDQCIELSLGAPTPSLPRFNPSYPRIWK